MKRGYFDNADTLKVDILESRSSPRGQDFAESGSFAAILIPRERSSLGRFGKISFGGGCRVRWIREPEFARRRVELQGAPHVRLWSKLSRS